jgi:branched-chain amino acid transport system permease protein
MMVEMLYHLSLESVNGTTMQLFGFAVDAATISPWLISFALLTVGGFAFWHTRPSFQSMWSEANTEIEDMVRRTTA